MLNFKIMGKQERWFNQDRYERECREWQESRTPKPISVKVEDLNGMLALGPVVILPGPRLIPLRRFLTTADLATS